MNARICSVLCVFCVAALVGCGDSPTFHAVTAPPPGAVGHLHNDKDEDFSIDLSQGAALGVKCEAKVHGGPCDSFQAKVEDPSIAKVYRAYAELRSDVYLQNYRNPDGSPDTVFVVVGKREGRTTIQVESGVGHKSIPVTIVPLAR
ncbi:MAG: hypothetical protein NVS3B20_05500 [Polyangiales bacterium]